MMVETEENYSLNAGFMCLLELFHGVVDWRGPPGLVWGKGEKGCCDLVCVERL